MRGKVKYSLEPRLKTQFRAAGSIVYDKQPIVSSPDLESKRPLQILVQWGVLTLVCIDNYSCTVYHDVIIPQ